MLTLNHTKTTFYYTFPDKTGTLMKGQRFHREKATPERAVLAGSPDERAHSGTKRKTGRTGSKAERRLRGKTPDLTPAAKRSPGRQTTPRCCDLHEKTRREGCTAWITGVSLPRLHPVPSASHLTTPNVHTSFHYT